MVIMGQDNGKSGAAAVSGRTAPLLRSMSKDDE